MSEVVVLKGRTFEVDLDDGGMFTVAEEGDDKGALRVDPLPVPDQTLYQPPVLEPETEDDSEVGLVALAGQEGPA